MINDYIVVVTVALIYVVFRFSLLCGKMSGGRLDAPINLLS